MNNAQRAGRRALRVHRKHLPLATAEAIFRKRVADAGLSDAIVADSAGTHDYHIGEPPDPRSQDAAAERGYDLSPLRARKVERADFQRFDLIVAMDRGH